MSRIKPTVASVAGAIQLRQLVAAVVAALLCVSLLVVPAGAQVLPALSISDTTVTELDGPGGTASFQVTLSGVSPTPVSVQYATQDGSAGAGTDYVTNVGILSFPAGTTQQTITVQLVGDTLDENTETFSVVLSNASGATISDGSGQGTITDNDPRPTVSIGDATVTEGDGGSTNASFTVSLNRPSTNTITVEYATASGGTNPATAGTDYTSKSGLVQFNPAEVSKTVSVSVLGDTVDEDDETFLVNLSNPSQAMLGAKTQGVGTIDDDDGREVALSPLTVTQPEASTSDPTFTVSIVSGSTSAGPITVTYRTVAGTATTGQDFVAPTGSATIPAGATSTSFTVDVTDDQLNEDDETFTVELTGADNDTDVRAEADTSTVTIADDDAVPTVGFDPAAVTVSEGGLTATFTVKLSAASGRTVTAPFETAPGSASQGSDYMTANGTVTFNPGQTSQTITVRILEDVADENDETFTVRLTGATNATLGSAATATGTITDNDAKPAITISDATLAEGDSGTTDMTFTVSLNRPSSNTVTVDFATADASATAPADYTATTGKVTFDPADDQVAERIRQTISVPVVGEEVDEGNETFFVNLSNATNATISDNQATGTIDDDDGRQISLSPAAVTVTEGSATTFTVTTDRVANRDIEVTYSTADDTATAPDDYAARNDATVTIPANQSSATFTVPTNDDALAENDETFTVELTAATNDAEIADGASTSTVTIDDNDADPTVAFTTAEVIRSEGDLTAAFPVKLNAPAGRTVTVAYATEPGTATANSDYVPASGNLTFNAGQDTQTITVRILEDVTDEDDENFTVSLTGATNATLGSPATATGTITDNDAKPALSVNDVEVSEVDEPATSTVTFTVSLNRPSTNEVEVDYRAADGSASSPADYTLASGTLTFSPGQLSQSVTGQIVGDELDEDAETFELVLENPSNATLGDGTGTATINDDDGRSVAIADAELFEGNSGSSSMVFNVTLDGAAGKRVTATYATTDDTATAGEDYTAQTGTVIFEPGDTAETISVPVAGDALDEPDERFFVDIGTVENADKPADARANGLIRNDDQNNDPTISILDTTTTEGQDASFVVQLSHASGQEITVDVETSDGTATAGRDYVPEVDRTLTFSPGGPTQQTVAVRTLNDPIDENSEEFTVTLSNPVQASLSDGQATGTITDDDAKPSISVDDPEASEGDGSTSSAVNFTVELSRPSANTVTVEYATVDDTALAGTDYVATSGTLTFEPGIPFQTVPVSVMGDELDEGTETFHLDLSEPTNADLAKARGTASINDNDGRFVTVSDAPVVSEAAAATTPATFTFALDDPANSDVVVSYTTADDADAANPATADEDYRAKSGTVTIPQGQESATVDVTVLDDVIDEPTEHFLLDISSVEGADEGTKNQGRGQIDDDEEVRPSVSVGDADAEEGNDVSFAVVLSNQSGFPVEVTYATATHQEGAHPAGVGEDYVITRGTVTFQPGETKRTVAVPTVEDPIDETDETFLLDLGEATNADLGDDIGIGTIRNDDAPPAVSVGDATVTEGDTDNNAVFRLTLNRPSVNEVTVGYRTVDESAVSTPESERDYRSVGDSVVFQSGETFKDVAVPVVGDQRDESTETFGLVVGPVTNATIAGDGRGQGTIEDDDGTSVSVGDASPTEGGTAGPIPEGDDGTTPAYFTFRLESTASRNVTITYSTGDQTATTADADYGARTGTAVIEAGSREATVQVPVNGDTRDEPDEIFLLNIDTVQNADKGDGQGQATITNDDDDRQPVVSIGDATVGPEGAAGDSKNAIFPATLNRASGQDVVVAYATRDGSAQAPLDYRSSTGTITIEAGDTSGTIEIPVLGDNLDEPDESFFVGLASATNATLADDKEGEARITDDDAKPRISIDNVAIDEGDSGEADATFNVTLSNPSLQTITVDYSTFDRSPGVGQATAGSDYDAVAPTTLTFAPGEVLKRVTVKVNGDESDETLESFFVRLSNPTSADISDPEGQGDIRDDDGLGVSIGDAAAVSEGNSGKKTASFPVTLTSTSDAPTTVNYETADGTARSPGDYVGEAGSITIPAGETTGRIDIDVNGDTADEADESFTVAITGASNPNGNVDIGDDEGTGTITDDDSAPTVGITAPAPVQEGHTGARNATFTVSLSSASGRTVTVRYATSNGSATTPSDYAASSGIVSFAPGETSRTINVPVLGDTADELDEDFRVTLSQPSDATLDPTRTSATGVIRDDDSAPNVSIGDVSVVEGGTGQVRTASFAVRLSQASGQTVTVKFATADGSATAGSDYTTTTGTLTFAPGQTSQEVPVPIVGDETIEPDERFSVNLSDATNATITTSRGNGTIVDDDSQASVSISDVSLEEGDSGTRDATFTITLSGAEGDPATVAYATGDGTATARSNDYETTSGTTTFAAGETTKTVVVKVNGDVIAEDDERFFVDLAAASPGVKVVDPQGTGTIRDDDGDVEVSIEDAPPVLEGDAGTKQALFTVRLAEESGEPVDVDFATADGTATDPEDYTSSIGSIRFGPGELTKTIAVTVKSDDIDEDNETFQVRLLRATNATLARSEASATITDDDDVQDFQCSDGVDNDGDGEIDAGSDPGCTDEEDDSEDSEGAESTFSNSTVSIRYGKGRFRGRVGADDPSCVAGRVVKVKKVRPGRDRTIRTASTDEAGRWRVAKARARGRFYAVVGRSSLELSDGDVLVCRKARSSTIRRR